MGDFAASAATMLAALVLVLALAWLALRWLSRSRAGRAVGAGRAAALRFVRALPVGPKERLVVVHYQGHEWVLGVTPGSISLLSKEPLAAAEEPSMSARQVAEGPVEPHLEDEASAGPP
jgi:flagellar protein FliO/FliZ